MKDKIYLSYINAADQILNNVDFNFDKEYIFSLSKLNTYRSCSYTLHVSKRKGIVQPEGFWGENINNVNVIMGKNGAGKTSLINFIINNIGCGITAMNGEGVVYVVKFNDKYIVYHNCARFDIANENIINICDYKEYEQELRNRNEFKAPYNNKRYWKNMIYFSNYFGERRLLRDDDFVINISKDKLVDKIIKNIKSDEIVDVNLQNKIQINRNNKVVKYMREGRFSDNNLNEIISVPNRICFFLNDEFKWNYEFEKFCTKQKDNFSEKQWIGKKRLSAIFDNSHNKIDNILEFEVAINTFSVRLMWKMLKKGYLREEEFQTFINKLSKTSDKTGIFYAKELMDDKEDVVYWKRLLSFLNEKEKYDVLMWQNEKQFVVKWSEEDIDIVEETVNYSNDLFFCQLIGEMKKGYYSSGQESRVNLVLALFEALDRVKEERCNDNNNILIMLDEIDAYFHPQYQIDMIKNILEIISGIFAEYQIQIILTSNTPLEISDIPSDNITYLENGCLSNNTSLTFGANVCKLIKNNFFINSSMGTFAKQKISDVISFLKYDEDDNMSKEEAEYVISIIGEPILKKKLRAMHDEKYRDNNSELDKFKMGIDEIKKIISNGEITNNARLIEKLDALKDTLSNS